MQIQTFIDKGITVWAGVEQEDPFLAIRHLAQMPTILPGHADGVFALFRKTAAVDDEHAGGIVQPLGGQGLQAGYQGLTIPATLADMIYLTWMAVTRG